MVDTAQLAEAHFPLDQQLFHPAVDNGPIAIQNGAEVFKASRVIDSLPRRTLEFTKDKGLRKDFDAARCRCQAKPELVLHEPEQRLIEPADGIPRLPSHRKDGRRAE